MLHVHATDISLQGLLVRNSQGQAHTQIPQRRQRNLLTPIKFTGRRQYNYRFKSHIHSLVCTRFCLSFLPVYLLLALYQLDDLVSAQLVE